MIFGTHTCQNRTDRQTELAQTSGAPAVHADGSILSKLFLCFMDLSNEVNETLPSFGHSLFWPISELELADSPRLTILMKTKTDRVIITDHSLVFFKCSD